MTARPDTSPEIHEGRSFLRRVRPLLRHMQRTRERTPRSPAVVGASLVVVIIGLGVAWSLLQNRETTSNVDDDPRILEALRELDQGNYERARSLATELRMSDLTFEDLGSPVFVLGAVLTHEADEQWNPLEQTKLYLIGSRYLEESRDRSFPKGREPQGLFLLGKSMVLGGRMAESIPILQEALAVNPQRRTTIHRYLALAYLHDTPPQPQKALPHLDDYLTDKLLSAPDRLEGWLLRAEIALQRDDLVNCRQALDDVKRWESEQQGASGLSATPGRNKRGDRAEQRRVAVALRDATIFNAKLTLLEAERPGDSETKQGLLRAALEQLADLAAQARETPESEYLHGVALRKLGRLAEARDQFLRTSRRSYGTAEGFASQIELAEIEQELGQDEAALENLLQVLKDVGDPAAYSNRWISIDQLRERVQKTYSTRLDQNDYERAAKIAEAMHPLFPEDDAVQTAARLYESWAEELSRRAETAPYSQAVALRQEAEQHYLQAGRAHERLAQIRFAERDYTENLWQCAENYLRAHSHRKGAEVIQQYLQNEPRRRRPRALTLLGEALLALGETTEARQYFEQCVAAYPKDPDSYRARIGAAQAALELGKLDESEQLLTHNLENELLTPRSGEWRDSLFLLGETIHRKGLELLTLSDNARDAAALDEQAQRETERTLEKAGETLEFALTRLTEATRRYPEDPRSVRARYLIADDYRHRSKLPRWKLPLETIESRRLELVRRMRTDLEAAYQTYDQLMKDLDRKDDTTELSPVELSVLRNCLFARAHALFDLERYTEAIEAYSTATSRYQNQPISLEAYEQIAACYRKLGDPAKARGTLEQARILISNMPTDIDYSNTTRFTREEWLNVLQ